MVPSAYRTVSSFPMTINGKIDMNALSIDLSHTNGEKTRMSKELNPTQKRIAKIWEDLIKTSNISLNDNFFDIGGTSLIAIRAVERIEKEFKIKLSARVFFDCPKIKCMAEHIDSKISEKSPASYEYPQIKSGRIVSREF
jgi:polyketide synthase PksJ